jgi:DNA helicase IV
VAGLSIEDISSEQAYVSALYDRLDGLRRRAATRLGEVLRQSESLPRARFEREVASADCAATLARIRAAENGLCFGRLDFDDGERRYIGRMGIFDEAADYEPLLIAGAPLRPGRSTRRPGPSGSGCAGAGTS